MTVTPLPLAAAALRLRGKPGRPRKHPKPGTVEAQSAGKSTKIVDVFAGAHDGPSRAPISVAPAVLALGDASLYLGVSIDTIEALEAGGQIKRLRVQMPGGKELRKVLYLRADLDALAAGWRA